jgi:predicted RNase H-like nuclease
VGSRLAAGVDGCRTGWLCVARDKDAHLSAFIAPTIEALVSRLPAECRIGIDMPIGMPATDSRECEKLARQIVGARRSSVFPVPLRGAIDARTRPEACALQVAVHARGKRIGAQTWGIMKKIREVDQYLRADRRLLERVFEIHPEVSFCLWNGGAPLAARKTSQAGKQVRATLIDGLWPGERLRIEAELRSHHRGQWAVDDLHDAFAALWTADRHVRGESRSLPENPAVDSEGLPMRIVG